MLNNSLKSFVGRFWRIYLIGRKMIIPLLTKRTQIHGARCPPSRPERLSHALLSQAHPSMHLQIIFIVAQKICPINWLQKLLQRYVNRFETLVYENFKEKFAINTNWPIHMAAGGKSRPTWWVTQPQHSKPLT